MFLEKQGVDVEIEYPFTEDFMNMEPEAFIEEILIGRLHAKYVVVGTDYHFGKGRMGNAQMLLERGPEYGFETTIVEKSGIRSGKSVVHMSVKSCASDTWKLSMCCLADPTASMVLYQRGKQLGRQLNLPTLNIYPPDSKLLPPNGVYASITRLDGKEYFGVTNLGVRPTLDDSPLLSVETNLFDYNDDAYGHYIEVQLMHFYGRK